MDSSGGRAGTGSAHVQRQHIEAKCSTRDCPCSTPREALAKQLDMQRPLRILPLLGPSRSVFQLRHHPRGFPEPLSNSVGSDHLLHPQPYPLHSENHPWTTALLAELQHRTGNWKLPLPVMTTLNTSSPYPVLLSANSYQSLTS